MIPTRRFLTAGCLLLLAILVIQTGAVRADILFVKSGEKIEGTVKDLGERFQVKQKDGRIRFVAKKDVSRWEKETAAGVTPAAETPTPGGLSVDEKDKLRAEAVELLKVLADKDLAARNKAKARLSEIGRWATKELAESFRLADSSRRADILDIYAKLDVPESVTAEIAALQNDPDANVRMVAARALGAVNSRTADAALIMALLKDADPGVRALAARTQGRRGNDFAVAALCKAFRDEKAGLVREAASNAIDVVASPVLTPYMVDLVDHPDTARTIKALSLLPILADPAAFRPLLHLSWSDRPQLSRPGAEALNNARKKSEVADSVFTILYDKHAAMQVKAMQYLINHTSENFFLKEDLWQKWWRKSAPSDIYLVPFGSVSKKLMAAAGAELKKNVDYGASAGTAKATDGYRLSDQPLELPNDFLLEGSTDTYNLTTLLTVIRYQVMENKLRACRTFAFVNGKVAGPGYDPIASPGVPGGSTVLSLPAIADGKDPELLQARLARLLLYAFARSFYLDRCLDNAADCPARALAAAAELDARQAVYSPRCKLYLTTMALFERALASGDAAFAFTSVADVLDQFADTRLPELAAYAAERGLLLKQAMTAWSKVATNTTDTNVQDVARARVAVIKEMEARYVPRLQVWETEERQAEGTM